MSFDISDQYDKVYRYCYLRVKKREIAEDITQETFLRYLEHPQYHNIDKTLQLLYTIAGNLCADEFRKRPSSEISEDTVAVNRKIKKILAALHNELGKEELQ